jgi:hypothetical protein
MCGNGMHEVECGCEVRREKRQEKSVPLPR